MPLSRNARRLRLESLEARELLATFVVTDPGDLDNGHTLRSAILASDATAGPNVIDFNLPAVTPEVITLASALPAITSPVLVDGSSQPGAFLNIEAAANSGVAGLVLDATGVTIRAVSVVNMTGAGIEIRGPGADVVQGGYVLGTLPPTGRGPDVPPVGAGIWINGSPGNTIGGGPAAMILSGNDGVGVLITGQGATHNLIQGSTIGASTDGSVADPNTSGGIRIDGASGNSIGTTAGDGSNLISGNGGDGIAINGPGADNTLIRSNTIGTDVGFATAVPNAGAGIDVFEASGTTIGGPAGSQNLISGNTGDGILLRSIPLYPPGGATTVTGNLIGLDGSHLRPIGNNNGIELQACFGVNVLNNFLSGNRRDGIIASRGFNDVFAGNRIGVDGTGFGAVPNGTDVIAGATFAGIELDGESDVQVGLPTTGGQNVISGNDGPGIVVSGGSLVGIESNNIGVDPTGRRRVPNRSDGILIENEPTISVGGSSPSDANVISSNYGDGIHILGRMIQVPTIRGNKIGTDPTGLVPLGNALDGIRSEHSAVTIEANQITANGNNGISLVGGSGSTIVGNTIGSPSGGGGNLGIGLQLIGSNNNTIGGALGPARNLIASNNNVGIYVSAGSSNNVISGNFIGLDGSGGGGRGNADGIVVRDSAGTTIGGTAAGAGNVVGSNGNYGIDISGTASTWTSIIGNIVGLAANGSDGAGNVADGVIIDGAPGVVVRLNFLSGNGGAGVQAVGASATGATIQSNLIGLDTTGTMPRGNGRGVIFNQAPGNTVGGASASGRNLIAANRAEGVLILGAGASGNQVASNWIGLDATGLRPQGNGSDGILIDAPRNVVGAAGGGGRNVIAASGVVGVHLLSVAATGNLVAGNWVGLDAAGLHALGSGIVGILLDGAPGNTIGGATAAGSGNLVTGSGIADVDVAGPGASGNLVAGNLIGTDSTGSALAAAPVGLLIDGASGNTAGGTTATAVNIIGGHSSFGVEIANPGATANLVFGNQVGPGQSGSPTLANGLGVLIVDAPGNTVGGVGSNPPNVIVGNKKNPIAVLGPKAVGNVVSPNVVGPGS